MLTLYISRCQHVVCAVHIRVQSTFAENPSFLLLHWCVLPDALPPGPLHLPLVVDVFLRWVERQDVLTAP